MPVGVHRVVSVVLLPLLAGGLLLMHGLDAPGVAAGHVEAAVAHHDDHDHAHCPECVAGHVVAACVAVAAAVVSLRVARRVLVLVRSEGSAPAAEPPWAELRRSWRPPDPAWVRLSVMRC